MGMAAILVMWPGPFEQLFVPLTPGGFIWNLVTIGPVVSEEKSFEIVDGRRRTTEPAYTISSPGAFVSGELKSKLVGKMTSYHVQGGVSIVIHCLCHCLSTIGIIEFEKLSQYFISNTMN